MSQKITPQCFFARFYKNAKYIHELINDKTPKQSPKSAQKEKLPIRESFLLGGKS